MTTEIRTYIYIRFHEHIDIDNGYMVNSKIDGNISLGDHAGYLREGMNCLAKRKH